MIFTAEGDMRQAINNLQSTFYGFRVVNEDNVFKVCDQPHPQLISSIVENCISCNVDMAVDILHSLWEKGYSSSDIISTLFKVVKTFQMDEESLKLEFMKEIGSSHLRILEGNQTLLQLSGLISRLCKMNLKGYEKNVWELIK